MLTTTF